MQLIDACNVLCSECDDDIASRLALPDFLDIPRSPE
jgi:hypothetical protein